MKKENTRTEIYGYTIAAPQGSVTTGRGWICLVKALLMFSASMGTVGSILSAFEMQVNLGVIVIFLLLTSLLLSFLHYRRLWFNLGYPMLFIIFVYSIFQNRIYVNSGYQAMVNVIRDAYRLHFNLRYSGETYEAIDDRYTTMTYALLYLGFFLVVLLNITISNYMSVFWTLLLTFPFLQFGLYIGRRPSVFAVGLLLFSYTAVALLKRSGHYALSGSRKKDSPFRERKQITSYKGQGRTMGEMAVLALVLTLVFSVVTYPLISLSLPGADATSSLKAATDNTVEKIVQSGFESLFNRYAASGGISGGRLGGVSRVQADYETDMEVTFVPTGTDTVYLKAYTGAEYTSQQWLAPERVEEDYDETVAFREADELEQLLEDTSQKGLRGKMVIENLDAATEYLYLPYYMSRDNDVDCRIDRGLFFGKSPENKAYTLYYYPYTQDISSILSETDVTGAEPKLQAYETYCKEYYTRIPDEVREALEESKEQIGEGKNLYDTLQRISNYFTSEFHYTVSPGTTPYNKDFASYFLQVQKEGYCAHFATAGTLLCRAYGIPARYVEGYVIQITDLVDGELQEDEEVADWLEGESSFTDSGVIKVSVPDANAHAWTEVYVDGFGWVPVDFTPPDDGYDTAEEYNSLLDIFSGLFSLAPDMEGTSATGGGTTMTTGAFSDQLFWAAPVGILALCLALLPVVWLIVRRMMCARQRRKAYRRGQYDQVLPAYYQRILKRLRKKKLTVPILPQEVFALLQTILPEMAEDTGRAANVFEKGIYAGRQISKEEADFFLAYTGTLLSNLQKTKILL
jgi:transglutaminase-like putative cysteine protease